MALALLAPVARAQEPAAGLSLNEALATTLVEQPQVALAREAVRISESTLQATLGRFDLRVGGSADLSRTVRPLRAFEREASGASDVEIDGVRFSAGVEKLLRSGLSVAVTAGMSRDDNIFDPPAANRSSVGVSFLQPLWGGRGEAVVGAEARAARLDVSASSEDLRFVASTSVVRTALAYWNYVAAARAVEAISASEERARRLLEDVTVLVEAGNRPAADLKQLRGNLAERVASRASVELQLFEARQALGLAMGLPADRIESLPLPSDAFPEPPEVTTSADPALVTSALARRPDLEAARLRERAVTTRIEAARDALEPTLDLVVEAGFSGLAEGRGFPPLVTGFGRELSGPNARVGVTYAFPPANNTAKGLLGRTDALRRQTGIQIDDLARTVHSNILVAGRALASSAARVRAISEAAEVYRSAVADEREKMQLGLSTIIDLVLIEDRLTRSLLDEIGARAAYAQALARLRFETGVLVTGTAADLRVHPDALTAAPLEGGR